MMKSGVYAIRNLANGKIYIGSTSNLKQRWAVHRCKLKYNRHGNRYLQKDWNEYGETSFEFIALEKVEIDSLVEREQWHLDHLFESSNYYNIAPMADSSLGVKHTAETIAKNRESNRGKIISAEQRAKISVANKGKIRNEATRSRISAARKGNGHPISAEQKAKLSVALKGKKKNKEHRAKLSIAAKLAHERRKAKEAVSI